METNNELHMEEVLENEEQGAAKATQLDEAPVIPITNVWQDISNVDTENNKMRTGSTQTNIENHENPTFGKEHATTIEFVLNKPITEDRTVPPSYSNYVEIGKQTLIKLVNKHFKGPITVVLSSTDCAPHRNMEHMEHIIELYNIPKAYRSQDILSVYKEQPCYIKWCDDTHALLVTSSLEQAKRALSINNSVIKSRSLSMGSDVAISVALENNLTPAKENKDQRTGAAKAAQLDEAPVIPITNVWQDISNVDTENNKMRTGSTQTNIENHENPTFGKEHATTIEFVLNKPITEDRTVPPSYWNYVETGKQTLIKLVNKHFKGPITVVLSSTDCTPHRNMEHMEHIIELYNIPKAYRSQDILSVYKEQPCYIKWCDDTHALLVTSSLEQAKRALSINNSVIKSRSLIMGSDVAISVALENNLTPAKENKNQRTGAANAAQLDEAPVIPITNVWQDISNVDTENNKMRTGSTQTNIENHENPTFGKEHATTIEFVLNKPITEDRTVPPSYWNYVEIGKQTLIKLVNKHFKGPITVVLSSTDCTPHRNMEHMEHIIELYNIPKAYRSQDILSVYKEQPCYIKWCDDTHALLVTSSLEQAKRALSINNSVIKSRSLIMGSDVAISVALENNLTPAKENKDQRTGAAKAAQLDEAPVIPITNVWQDISNVDTENNKMRTGSTQTNIENHENPTFGKEHATTIEFVLNKPITEDRTVPPSYWNYVEIGKQTLIKLVNKHFKGPITVVLSSTDCTPYRNMEHMEHIIELYTIPKAYRSQDILSVYKEQPCYIKWCDDTHALLVTSSLEQAKRALSINNSVIKSRSLIMGSDVAISVALENNLTPAKENKNQRTGILEAVQQLPAIRAEHERAKPDPKPKPPPPQQQLAQPLLQTSGISASQAKYTTKQGKVASIQLYKSASISSLQTYSKLQDYLDNHSKTFVELLQNDAYKQFRFNCKKAVNIPVNAISAVSARHLLDKYKRLSCLLSGNTVRIGGKYVCAAQHPQGMCFCMNLLAKKFVLQGDLMISSNMEAAFSYATIIVGLWNEHRNFGKLLLAHFHRQCPYLVPLYPARDVGQSDEDFYRSQGYQYIDGVLEKQDKFLKRMTGIMRLYAAIIISVPKRGQMPNPHGLAEGWKWLQAFLNLEPKPDVTATMLRVFFEIAGFTMQTTFGKAFQRLMAFVCRVYLPLIQQIDSGGPITRLEMLLQKYVKMKRFEPPHGILASNFWQKI